MTGHHNFGGSSLLRSTLKDATLNETNAVTIQTDEDNTSINGVSRSCLVVTAFCFALS